MKIKKNDIPKFINVVLFILIYAFRSITDAIYIAKGIESNFLINLKYFFIAIAIILCILQFKKKEKIFRKELYNIVFVLIILFLISIATSLINWKFYSGTLENCFKMLLPIIYVYCFINVMDYEEIYKSMVGALIFSFIGYVLEIGTSNFSIANLKLLDFSSSYSPFESSFAAGASIALCIFFMYYRKSKLFTVLSLIFAVLTFKRLSVLFALIMLIIPHFIDVNKEVKPGTKNFIKILFIILTILYYQILLPQNSEIFERIFHDTQNKFTMGRSTFLRELLSMNYFYSGLGSTTEILGKSLEMDLIRLYLETSILGLIVFIFGYWECSGKNRYTCLYMLFQFLNLLTSHSLGNSFNWILTLITIACITYKKEEKFKFLNIKIVKSK